jgi:GntR family negative regulator for fad regulon and positive regulator of fabA
MADPQEERTTDRAERQLIESIVSGVYPPHSYLPGERTLSKVLDLARPALREAMQRLSRDGWLDIQQGKPTRIRDYLQDGNLNILVGLLKTNPDLVPNLVPNLLEMWQLLAPQYTASTTRRAPGLMIDLLHEFQDLAEEPELYAESMWQLHHLLITYCDNLIYGLIFNTFQGFYSQLAVYYFQDQGHREQARDLWSALIPAAQDLDTDKSAELIAEHLSIASAFWEKITIEQYRDEVLPEPETEVEIEKSDKKKKK